MIIVLSDGSVTGASFPSFPSDADLFGQWEPFRETGYSAGQGISPLTDWSGNGNHWTQSNSTFRPQFEPGVINGLAVANGDHGNNNGWNVGPDMSELTAVHIFAVIKAKFDPATDLGQTGLWNLGTAADSAHVGYTNGFIYDDAGSNSRRGPLNRTTNLASAFFLYEIISTSSEWTRIINGAAAGSGNDHYTEGTNTVACPASPSLLVASGASSRHKLAGMYAYSAKKTGSPRTALINYLNDAAIFATSFS